MAVVRRAVRRPDPLLLAPLLALVLLLGLAPPAQASLIGAVSGTITGGGVPLANVWVTLIPVTGTGSQTGTQKLALTGTSGRFEFPEVYDRNVKILVRAPAFSGLVDTYYPTAPTFALGEMVEISSWPIVADVDLPEAGSVSGRVVDLDTGAAVEGARVTAAVSADTAAGRVGQSMRRPEPGGFHIAGLPPVDVKLKVALPAHSPYLDTPYEPGSSTSGVLVDGSQDTSGTVIGLRRGAEIRGTVRDEAGTPLPGATIKVIGCVPDCPLHATSDSTGAYRIPGLRPASRLGVVAWRGSDHLHQWFPDRDNASLATDITVGFGDVLADVDFELTPASYLTVEVRGSLRDEPLRSIAMLMTLDGESTMYFSKGPAQGATAGDPAGSLRLRVGPVPPGEYELRISPGAANPGYLPARWLTSTGTKQSTMIRLRAGEDSAVFVRLPVPAQRDVPGERRPSTAASGWPGLAQGFLSTPSWVDPAAAMNGGQPAANPVAHPSAGASTGAST